jgi:hypothetical protein
MRNSCLLSWLWYQLHVITHRPSEGNGAAQIPPALLLIGLDVPYSLPDSVALCFGNCT